MQKLNYFLKVWITRLLCLQLLITSPGLAWAQSGAALGSAVATGAASSLNNIMAAYQQAQMQQRVAAQEAQLRQTLGVKSVDPKEVHPFFSSIPPACNVLEARTNQLGTGDKCETPASSEEEVAKYYALASIADQNFNEYTNYLTVGNSTKGQGVDCYQRQLDHVQALLQAQVAAIDNMIGSVNTLTDQIEAQIETPVRQMREAEALLTGNNLSTLLPDMQLANRFNDEQCRSYFSDETFQNSASQGLAGIRDKLQESYAQGDNSPSNMLAQANSRAQDIRTYARELGTQMAGQNPSSINAQSMGELGIRSQYNLSASPAVMASVNQEVQRFQNGMQERERVINERMQTAQSDDGTTSGLSTIFSNIRAGQTNIATQLDRYKRNTENTCLQDYLNSNFGGAQGLTRKLEDPALTSSANRKSDSAFKNFVSSTLSNSTLTSEEKLRRIAQQEGQGNNATQTLRLGKSVTLDGGQTIEASDRLTASGVASIFIKNCEKRYRTYHAPLANEIQSYYQEYQTYAANVGNKIANNIIENMISCPDRVDVGVTTNSCQGSLDSNSENFCLRTATKCAQNAKACVEKANQLYRDTRNQQVALANSYKQSMDNYKASLLVAFNNLKNQFEVQARSLDAIFKTGSFFNMPNDFDMSMVQEGAQVNSANLLDGIDPNLQIEDPMKFKQQITKNLEKLKKETIEHNQQLLNGGNAENLGGQFASILGEGGLVGMINRVKDNYETQAQEWQQIAQQCINNAQAGAAQLAQAANQAAQEANELNQEVAQYCSKLDAFNNNPLGACDDAKDLADTALEIGAKVGANPALGVATLHDFQQTCESVNNESSNPHMSLGQNPLSVEDACADSDFLSIGQNNSLCNSRNNNSSRACTPQSNFRHTEWTIYEPTATTREDDNDDTTRAVSGRTMIVKRGSSGSSAPRPTGNYTEIEITLPDHLGVLETYADAVTNSVISELGCTPNGNEETNEDETALQEAIIQYAAIRSMQETGNVIIPFCTATPTTAGRNGGLSQGAYSDAGRALAGDSIGRSN